MRYTNTILTIIAILLALHLVKPFFVPANAVASKDILDINIVKVADRTVFNDSIPVYITENKDK